MDAAIALVHSKKNVEQSNVKITKKSNELSNNDSGSNKNTSSIDIMDKAKNKITSGEDNVMETNNFSMEVSSNQNKSDDIFDSGKSSFDFMGNTTENEFSMNFDTTANSNFEFANFDFGNEENNDNSFTFNFGENSEESQKNDKFSLF